MGKRIYKKKLIDEINQKIQMCEIYQEQDPDIMAIQRVSMLSKIPCADGKYYVNVLLKKPGVLHTYTNPAEIIEKSSYNGIINGDNTAKNIELVLDKTSKIKLTGDSYVTKLTNSDSSNSNIDFNGHKLYVNEVAVN